MLLSYPGNESLAGALARVLHGDSIEFEMRRFPDGETYLRIASEVRDRSIAVLCTLHDPDPLALPLIYLSDTLRQLGAAQVGLIAPYLAYMRQDRRFKPGEALTSASFARVLSQQFDWLVTVDPHLHRRRSLAEIYTIPTHVAHAGMLMADWIRREIPAPLIVGPDAESEQWVRAVAGAVSCPYIVLEKVRRGDRDVAVSVASDIHQWAGRTPVLLDDIVSSARTMIEAVRLWRAAGYAPACLAVHGVFASGAHDALLKAGASRVITTDSIPHPSNEISLIDILVKPVTEFTNQRPGTRSRTEATLS